MQVNCDWGIIGTKENIEEKLGEGFEFTGPGFYLTPTDTLLVVAEEYSGWKRDHPKGTVFHVFVYNCHFGETIFANCGNVPVRSDTR